MAIPTKPANPDDAYQEHAPGYQQGWSPDGQPNMYDPGNGNYAPFQGHDDASGEKWVNGTSSGVPGGHAGSYYTDPVTGERVAVQPDFSGGSNGKDGYVPGRWGLVHALSDPSSDISNNFYYGGSRDFSKDEYNRQNRDALLYGNRSGPSLDFGDSSVDKGFQVRLNNGLTNAINGDPNSVAQNDLRNLYAQGNAQASSAAAGARGGLAARALANRTAMNQLGDNQQAYNVGASQLMANEQMNAMGQQSGLLKSIRDQDQRQAFGTASIESSQQNLNDQMTQNSINRGMHAAGMGLQGAMNKESMRRNLVAANLGYSNAENKIADRSNAMLTNTLIGATQGTIEAGAKMYSDMNTPEDGKKK